MGEKDGGASMSDQSKKLRRRKTKICNTIHNMTWLGESFTSCTIIVFQIFLYYQDPYLVQSISDILAILFYRIVAPFTHLFNEKRLKLIVLDHGWNCAMKAAIRFDIEETDRQPNRNFIEGPHISIFATRVSAFKPLSTTHMTKKRVNCVSNKKDLPSIESRKINAKKQTIHNANIQNSENQQANELPHMVPTW